MFKLRAATLCFYMRINSINYKLFYIGKLSLRFPKIMQIRFFSGEKH